jgi:ABC transporter substrate binding protein
MKRRDFITLAGGVAAVWPLAARAQQRMMPVIGFLHGGASNTFAVQMGGFHTGLKEGGFVEGQNLTIEYRWAEEHPERLPAMAADLVRRRVAVIVAAGGTNSIRAAKAATTTIPIVFSTGSDPVRLGLVTSLARPGGNTTGVSFFSADLAAKAMGLLSQIAPKARVVALLFNPNIPDSARQPADALSSPSSESATPGSLRGAALRVLARSLISWRHYANWRPARLGSPQIMVPTRADRAALPPASRVSKGRPIPVAASIEETRLSF